MKIIGQHAPKTPELGSGKTKESERHAESRQSPSTEAPSVARPRVPLTVQRVREVIESTADVRAEKVAALKAKIDSGEYSVDSERLAHNMLNAAIREDLERD